jgi:HAD superfamily hydrolase (TIGR01509 family)
VRDRHPWFNEFQVRVLSCEVGEAKPEPAIFVLAAERLQVRAQQCLFVDDREANIAGAQQAGMQTLHFASAGSLGELKQRLSEGGMGIEGG